MKPQVPFLGHENSSGVVQVFIWFDRQKRLPIIAHKVMHKFEELPKVHYANSFERGMPGQVRKQSRYFQGHCK
jgi:hypothetical protein